MPQPCTRETKRCEFWLETKDYVRPNCCTSHLRELLFFTEDLLSRHGIFHWLDYGSLLGAVREQALIRWDTDVDWGFLAVDLERVRALEPEIRDAGHWLDTRDPQVWRVNYSRHNLQHVDLYPWRIETGSGRVWAAGIREREFFPVRFLEQLEQVQLYERTFPAPSSVHEFLNRHRYGETYLIPRRPCFGELGAVEANDPMQDIQDVIDTVRANREQIRRFERNLVKLYDTLRSSPIADRYWVIGGMLIGWAREGRVLPHDSRDADFGYLRRDREDFLASVPLLTAAGFRPVYRYLNHAGEPVEYTFAKHGARFDFFEHAEREGFFTYSTFGSGRNGSAGVEIISQIDAHRLAPMEFLGRTWQKPADHNVYLNAIYGDWTEPNPQYNCFRDDRTIVETRPWNGTCDWPTGIAREQI